MGPRFARPTRRLSGRSTFYRDVGGGPGLLHWLIRNPMVTKTQKPTRTKVSRRRKRREAASCGRAALSILFALAERDHVHSNVTSWPSPCNWKNAATVYPISKGSRK